MPNWNEVRDAVAEDFDEGGRLGEYPPAVVSPITVDIPRPLLLSLNDRTGWRAQLQPKKTLRELGLVHGRKSGIRLDRARLVVIIHWPDGIRRDRHNFIPTIKPLIDGMVDAGVIRDDDDDHLEGPLLYTAKTIRCRKPYAARMDFIFQAVA